MDSVGREEAAKLYMMVQAYKTLGYMGAKFLVDKTAKRVSVQSLTKAYHFERDNQTWQLLGVTQAARSAYVGLPVDNLYMVGALNTVLKYGALPTPKAANTHFGILN